MFATSQVPGYSMAGIPGLNGGYAYAPGSRMTQFMDNLNTTTTYATKDVVSWAHGLAYQAQLREQAEAAAMMSATTASTGSSADKVAQIIQIMLTMLAALAQKQA